MASSIAWIGSEGSTPYRRIILGLSISDIFFSLAFLTGPLSVPESKVSWTADHEVTSCKANGFILQVGATAVGLHTCYLCFYYLCKLKYRMSDEAFTYKLEGKIRAVIVVFCLAAGIVPLVMDAYHTTSVLKSFCTISPVPTGCLIEPEVVGECDSAHGKRDSILKTIFITGIHSITFLGIIVMMALLYRHTYTLNQFVKRETEVHVPTRLRSGNFNSGTSVDVEEIPLSNDENTNVEHAEKDEENNIGVPQETLQNISRLYHKEMTIQAASYVVACFIIYTPTMVSLLFDKAPDFLLAVAMFTFPIGGFLNILVYTRPKVAELRRAHPTCSWMRGFWLVLKAGGEIPNEVDLSTCCCQGCCGQSVRLEESESQSELKVQGEEREIEIESESVLEVQADVEIEVEVEPVSPTSEHAFTSRTVDSTYFENENHHSRAIQSH